MPDPTPMDPEFVTLAGELTGGKYRPFAGPHEWERVRTDRIAALWQRVEALVEAGREPLLVLIGEVAASGLEWDAGKYLTIQIDPDTFADCCALSTQTPTPEVPDA